MFPLETLPPGNPSRGVVYLRIVLSPEESSRLRVFLNISFYREGLLAPRPNPKLEDHPSSAVRDCLFNLFVATLLIGGRSSIHNLRTRHTVVTGSHTFKVYIYYCHYRMRNVGYLQKTSKCIKNSKVRRSDKLKPVGNTQNMRLLCATQAMISINTY